MLKLVFDYTHGNILDIGKYHKLMLSISINSLLKWWLQWYGEIYYLRRIAICVASCSALSDNLATLENLLGCPSIAWEVVDWVSADSSLACLQKFWLFFVNLLIFDILIDGISRWIIGLDSASKWVLIFDWWIDVDLSRNYKMLIVMASFMRGG